MSKQLANLALHVYVRRTMGRAVRWTDLSWEYERTLFRMHARANDD